MEAQEFIELYESCWFEMEIFKKQVSLTKSSGLDHDPDHQIQETPQKPEIYRVPSMLSRSLSDQLCSKLSFTSGLSLSPDSVLFAPKLQTIISSKELSEEEAKSSLFPLQTEQQLYVQESPNKKARNRRRRGKKILSKSLSELEFEELKGFMDLGFVFSEEDKDSNLVSIIPGLQRLGNKYQEIEKTEKSESEVTVSRPYLSEAWEELDKRKKEEPLVNWRIPALKNEIDMKDNLRWWAHTVASTVR